MMDATRHGILNPEAAQQMRAQGLALHALPLTTPVGPMVAVAQGEYLRELRFGGMLTSDEIPGETPLLRQAADQLEAYFAGTLTRFSVPLAPLGTAFQTLVWRTLADTVAYGETVSYGELARRCERPAAARAVGMANHRNPLPILIPCHRVIGSTGQLVGYGGGLPLKERLLALEAHREGAPPRGEGK